MHWRLRERPVYRRSRVFTDRAVFTVADDADDLIRGRVVVIDEVKPAADRIPRQVPPRKELVDDDDTRRASTVVSRELAPGQ